MASSDLATSTDLRPFAERVHERSVGPCHIVSLPTPVDDVVSLRGSFLTRPDFAAGEELVQEVVVEMLDKGTRQRDRFAIAEVIEGRGAQLDFYASGLRCGFSGRVLKDDLPDLVDVVAEQLREPLFDPAEFEKAKARLAARFQRSMENTGAQASAALSRQLYRPAHPSYTPAPEANLERLAALDLDAVRAFHDAHFGASGLHVVAVGDLDDAALDAAVRDGFGDWTERTPEPRFDAAAQPADPDRVDVAIPDKSNIDVRLGHALAVRRDHADYLPLFLANYVLGGNFSARLMTIVRDELGLTYGTGSSLVGCTVEHDGYWRIAVTLSPDSVERGIDATRGVVQHFAARGITAVELDDKQTTLTGAFKVGLATTRGLAVALLRNVERGFGPAYLDRYPEEIQALTLDAVNDAIHRHFDPNQLHCVRAGTFVEEA